MWRKCLCLSTIYYNYTKPEWKIATTFLLSFNHCQIWKKFFLFPRCFLILVFVSFAAKRLNPLNAFTAVTWYSFSCFCTTYLILLLPQKLAHFLCLHIWSLRTCNAYSHLHIFCIPRFDYFTIWFYLVPDYICLIRSMYMYIHSYYINTWLHDGCTIPCHTRKLIHTEKMYVKSLIVCATLEKV